MEHYKIEAISDILTRSDLGNTRADFADLVDQFVKLKTERKEQAAQLELDLQKTRDEAFALFDSVPFLADWIAERVQQLELSGDQDYIKENIDFDSIINNYLDENINLEEMISERVDFDELVSNNLDFQELALNHVDFDEIVSNCMDSSLDELVSDAAQAINFEDSAREAAITAVDGYIQELSISIRID